MTPIEIIERDQAALIDEILVGAVDPHVHSGPSIAPRAVDHLNLAKTYSDAGFAALVTKDHDYSGVMCAQLIRDHHPELKTEVFSGIVLNNVVGGLNPYAVEHTAAMNGKIVWLPTLAAENHLEWEKTSGWEHPATTQKIRPASAVPLFKDGKLLPELLDILDVVAATGLALASGHIHVSETKIVFAEARRRGVERLIFTHPEDIVGASFEDTKEIAAMGAFVEHSLGFLLEVQKQDRRRTTCIHRLRWAGADDPVLRSRPGRFCRSASRASARRRDVPCLGICRRRHPRYDRG